MSLTENSLNAVRLAETEALLDRFEERVRAAQLKAPATRDLVRRSVRRQDAARCPVWLRRVTLDVVVRHGEALMDLFDEFPDDLGRVSPHDFMLGLRSRCSPPLSPVEALLADSTWTNEWGVVWRHVRDGVGATEVEHPLKDWGQLDAYLAERFPDPRGPGRFDATFAPARAFREAGTYSFGLLGPVFYHIFSIRGMENALADLRANPAELRRLVDALRDFALELVRSWGTVGVDAIMMLDDWGTQRATMMSPAVWRDFFKEGYAVLIREAHALGMDVFLHSCGCVTGIVEDLIEVGLDVLDPVQTSAMDIAELARRFGGRISFCGTIDVQDLLPRARPDEVKDAIRRARDVLGRPYGNGLILAPTNTITPEVPLENLRAMFEACHEE